MQPRVPSVCQGICLFDLPLCWAFDEGKGYVWGKPVTHLLEVLPGQNAGFDVVLMSDLIFNHSQVCIWPTDFG